MKCTIVIVSFNTKELIINCLRSILSKKWKNDFDIVVSDNNSTDGSMEQIEKEFPRVRIIKNKENLGFSRGNNVAIEQIKNPFYLLLNSDVLVLDHSLDNLLSFMKDGKYQIVSCKLLNSDKTFQPNAGDLPTLVPVLNWLSGLDDFFPGFPSFHKKNEGYYKGRKEVGWVGGTALMIKEEVLEKIGFLDENIFMYGEDVEYCLRAKRSGFRIGWTDNAQIVHLGGGSSENPQFVQWLGEFKGLIYIYKKYYGDFRAYIILLLIYFFTLARAVVYLILGEIKFSKIYAKVLINL